MKLNELLESVDQDHIDQLLDELESYAAGGVSNMSDEEKEIYNGLVDELKHHDPENADSYEYAEELDEGFRVSGKTSDDAIRRHFKTRSKSAKKKRGGKSKRLTKGRSGFGRPPRSREIRR